MYQLAGLEIDGPTVFDESGYRTLDLAAVASPGPARPRALTRSTRAQ
ncbi:MAG TPA: hypothetical protein VFI28_08800 [Candidatus Limnocylindrales bacterium]|nr:hypothetical protein [Candidatus Limnocylindrales bacterium]